MGSTRKKLKTVFESSEREIESPESPPQKKNNTSVGEKLIVIVVILNTLVMALEKEPKSKQYDMFLNVSNIVSFNQKSLL